jgi:branched-chain amino acid transport system permease protein
MTALLIVGITLGSIYVLMALGMTLVYGVTRVFNYSQGAFFTWGAYFAWLLSSGYFHFSFAIAIPLTLLIMFLFGLVFEKIVIYPLRRLPDWGFTAVIVTLGCALLLDNLALVCFGGRHKTLPSLLEGSFDLGGTLVTYHNLLILLTAIGIVIAFGLFLGKTRLGMAMRAVAQDETGARIVGLPINRIYTLAFGLSAVLAGISAILLVPRTLIYPYVGWGILIRAFVVMVLGGLGSFKGTFIAGFALGMVEAITTFYLGQIWGLPVFLVVLVIVLIFRPKGLFGTWA